MWDNITSAGAWEGRNANITNLKISFLSLDGKSCDCRSERGEENTERRAFFTLAGFRSFYRRRGQQKFRQSFAAGREENLYCTGDWVTLDEKGNYLFVGRKHHMIKTRGYRVELGEIEAVMVAHPAVEEAVALAIQDDEIGNTIRAIVTLRIGVR